MTLIDLAYFNYEHGGLRQPDKRGGVPVGGYDFTGLTRVFAAAGCWPHLLVMGEGDYYRYWGGAPMWGAAEALREAAREQGVTRAYVPLACELPRGWGPFAPIIFFDAASLVVQQWFDPYGPDPALRNRNVLIVRPVDGAECIELTVTHGDIFSSLHRQIDAEEMRWLADERILGAILGDFNEPLSGQRYQPNDLEDTSIYDRPWRFLNRLVNVRGRVLRPYRRTTAALDVLCGVWNEKSGQREGGIGMVDVMEQAGVCTGTNIARPNGRQQTAIDHILLNGTLAARVVPGSARVHDPLPDHPSDHLMLSVRVAL